MPKICVFGSGSFGTALGTILARNGNPVVILARSPETVQSINEKHINPRYFSDITLPENLTATNSAEEALKGAEFILHVVPVQHSYDYLRNLAPLLFPNVPIISCSKGIHASTLKYMSNLIPEVLGYSPPTAFFSGPSFARELLEFQPSAVVVASTSIELATQVQHLFANNTLRVYTTTDVTGVELGGALKNVFAIAAGVLQGMGFGKNSMAALITRACSEMRKLALAMGANPVTIAGLSGVGDLMLTCYGKASRNRTVGERLGQGESLESVMSSMTEVAEGVFTTPAAVTLAKQYNLDLPIIFSVGAILDGSITAMDALKQLMTRPQSYED